MASSPSGGRRRPLSTSGYEPLMSEKPKPPPKPRPQLLKAASATGDIASGYFQPSGGSGIGYCLSSVYKAKKTASEHDERGEEKNVPSQKLHEGKLKFSTSSSRPSFTALPAKFRVSFEERNQQNLESLSKSDIYSDKVVQRRPPPPIPKDSQNRKSNPLPCSSISTQSLPIHSTDNWSVPINSTSSSKSSGQFSLEASPTPSTPSPTFCPTRPVTFAQPPPLQMEYSESEHPKNVFQYLDKFRHTEELCDVTILANGKELKAHRVVLAASSQFFESMFIGEFAEPANEAIVVEELSDNALESMINFAYTSQIQLTEKNVYPIFEAADLLQFNGIKGACFKFFKQQVNKSNCIRTWLFAQTHNCGELLDASLKFIDYNFLDIVRGKEFFDMDQPDVISDITCREELAITSEEQVYEAVLAWIRNKSERKKYALQVFKKVRFPSMSKNYLMNVVDNEPLIKEDPDLLQLLIDALQSHVTVLRGTLRKKNKCEDQSTVGRPRASSMALEVVDVYRENALLGLRIMGGVDRPQHVFRQGDKSGVFILQILEGSAAAKVGKLRPGDRILQLNDVDMTTITHESAIRILKTSPDPLSFHVRHEPAPAGLKEVTLVTKPGEGFGFVITGGVNGYPGNPLDDTDEGIFLSQIIPGGAAEQDDRLKVGTRILQVNSISMLGKTHTDALKVLQGVLDRLCLLVCDGYDPDAVVFTPEECYHDNSSFL